MKYKRRGVNIFNNSVSMVKNTSRKYMPKVKHSLENVGSQVIKTSNKSVPFFQRMTRKLFNLVGLKSRKRR
jgi:hypothetical protein